MIDDIMYPSREAREGIETCDAQLARLEEELAKLEGSDLILDPGMIAGFKSELTRQADHPEDGMSPDERLEHWKAAGRQLEEETLVEEVPAGALLSVDQVRKAIAPRIKMLENRLEKIWQWMNGVERGPGYSPPGEFAGWFSDEGKVRPWQRPNPIWDRGTGAAHDKRVRDLSEDPGEDGGIGAEQARQKLMSGGRDAITTDEARDLAEKMGADAPLALADIDDDQRPEEELHSMRDDSGLVGREEDPR